jgi:hypothetical protein
MSKAYTVCLESLNGRHHKEDLEIDGKIILNWIVSKQDGKDSYG